MIYSKVIIVYGLALTLAIGCAPNPTPDSCTESIRLSHMKTDKACADMYVPIGLGIEEEVSPNQRDLYQHPQEP